MALFTLKRNTYNKEVSKIVSALPYKDLSPVQKYVIPLLLKNKEIAVESVHGDGRVGLIIFSHVLAEKVLDQNIKTVVVTESFSEVNRISQRLKYFKRRLNNSLTILSLGKEGDTKKEVVMLKKQHDILVITAQRLIDHMRRDNFTASGYDRIFIFPSENTLETGSNRDLSYIISKTAKTSRHCLLLPNVDIMQNIETSGTRFLTITRDAWIKANIEYAFTEYSGEDPSDLLIRVLQTENFQRVCLIANEPQMDTVANKLLGRNFSVTRFSSKMNSEESSRVLFEFQKGIKDILVTDTLPELSGTLLKLDAIIFYNVPENTELLEKAATILEQNESDSVILTFIEKDEASDFLDFVEKNEVVMKKQDYPVNNEALSKTIKGIIKKIREEEDIEEIVQYKKIIKKNVSIFNRSVFSAYLLKELYGDKTERAVSDYTTLFVGIGKNKRIFPRDLIRLIISKCGVDRKDIGNIKILDNYSFVEMDAASCDNVISKMSDAVYRGRKLNVNYARKKDN